MAVLLGVIYSICINLLFLLHLLASVLRRFNFFSVTALQTTVSAIGWIIGVLLSPNRLHCVV